MTTALATLTAKLADTLGMGDGSELIPVLRQTAFKSQNPVTDAQLTALLVVANQYGLNPWTKEIYAYPDKQNGIVPVVGLDGWSRIINRHPQFDGMDFVQDDASCTCIIYRKDRAHPIKVTEWMEECYRPAFKKDNGYEVKGPWQSHPRRMLRHKAMIQCARLAFGFTGIFDNDEAERILESIDDDTGEVTPKAEVKVPQPKSKAELKSKPDVTDVEPKAATVQEQTVQQEQTGSQEQVSKAPPPPPTAPIPKQAGAGEVAYIKKKIEAKGWSIEEAMAKVGIPHQQTLEGLTLDAFIALRDICK